MAPDFISRACESLSIHGPDPQGIERIRALLGAETLVLHPFAASREPPASSDVTRWVLPLEWQGRTIAWLEGSGPRDETALGALAPLLAWSLTQQWDREQTEARLSEVQVRASRALDLSELVTWLLHARDEAEVEQLGTSAVSTLLKVDAGALLTRGRGGRWLVRVPARELIADGLELEGSRHLELLTRNRVELECDLAPEVGPLERVLHGWGYRHAFAVPLDSGSEPQGVLLALSTTEQVIDPEARVAAAQLSIMISVALDRLARSAAPGRAPQVPRGRPAPGEHGHLGARPAHAPADLVA